MEGARCKVIYAGSEPANGISLEQVRLINVYCMSESFFTICDFLIDRPYEICPVGKPPYEGIRIRLLGENGEEVPEGETGEVCVEMPFFRGYIGLPEQTEKALQNGLFHTSDLAKRLPDGNLVIRIHLDVCFVQRFDPGLEPELTIESVTEKELNEIKDDLIQPFVMVNNLIYRFRIFETETHIYVFLDLHHLFNDGVSANILIRNLSEAYNGRELPPDRAFLYARDSNKWAITQEYEDAKNRMLAQIQIENCPAAGRAEILFKNICT